MNFGLQWNRYTMRGPIHGKYFDFAIGCLWNLCKNVYIWCRLSSNGMFGPNKNGLQRFHRCFTGNSKCLPWADYLTVDLVQCCQKFTLKSSSSVLAVVQFLNFFGPIFCVRWGLTAVHGVSYDKNMANFEAFL